MEKTRKIISMIMAIVLCAAMLPVTGFSFPLKIGAEDNTQASFSIDNSTSKLDVLELDSPLENCVRMTVDMRVTMGKNTKCSEWLLLGRTHGVLQEIGKLKLPSGNGDVVQTVTFDPAVSIDAIAIWPTIPGNYSWHMDITLKDIECSKIRKYEIIAGTKKVEDGQLTKANLGSVVLFGRYEQDNNSKNGAEPIAWIVLEKKKDTGDLLLISLNCLDCVPFHNRLNRAAWKDSSLRKWILDDFTESAFTKEELVKLMPINPQDVGNTLRKADDDSDYITLLSAEEAERYLPTEQERRCTATAYAQKKGVAVNKDGAIWWLRSVGKDSNHAKAVTTTGKIPADGKLLIEKGIGFRPVILLHLPK